MCARFPGRREPPSRGASPATVGSVPGLETAERAKQQAGPGNLAPRVPPHEYKPLRKTRLEMFRHLPRRVSAGRGILRSCGVIETAARFLANSVFGSLMREQLPAKRTQRCEILAGPITQQNSSFPQQ
ncbi:hypothetical protein AAFF_G00432410 [Aldrovandia affinis]|uniref:Uncharacterized protein n=1 Tax=Aldrovandia affinis TaxID=143900 RepID=A0AAD7S8J2_9TELE|nr:hypothetical protein AAFF_G00432410 [Aldrovandia affinis]